ncbi:unnamed protein product [Amoebophrya sp. A120]|nr:unnamed protein product [Amoebophrya sp. A120]|eukprot:GSA120T00014138001.1
MEDKKSLKEDVPAEVGQQQQQQVPDQEQALSAGPSEEAEVENQNCAEEIDIGTEKEQEEVHQEALHQVEDQRPTTSQQHDHAPDAGAEAEPGDDLPQERTGHMTPAAVVVTDAAEINEGALAFTTVVESEKASFSPELVPVPEAEKQPVQEVMEPQENYRAVNEVCTAKPLVAQDEQTGIPSSPSAPELQNAEDVKLRALSEIKHEDEEQAREASEEQLAQGMLPGAHLEAAQLEAARGSTFVQEGGLKKEAVLTEVQEICAIEIDAPKKQHEHHARDEEMFLATESEHLKRSEATAQAKAGVAVEQQDDNVNKNVPLHQQTENKPGIPTTAPADENSEPRAEQKMKNPETSTFTQEELLRPREGCQVVAVEQAKELKLLQIKENEAKEEKQQSIVEPERDEVKQFVPQEKLQQPEGKLVQLESGKVTATEEIESARMLNTTEEVVVNQHAATGTTSTQQVDNSHNVQGSPARSSSALCPRPADLQAEVKKDKDAPVLQMHMRSGAGNLFEQGVERVPATSSSASSTGWASCSNQNAPQTFAPVPVQSLWWLTWVHEERNRRERERNAWEWVARYIAFRGWKVSATTTGNENVEQVVAAANNTAVVENENKRTDEVVEVEASARLDPSSAKIAENKPQQVEQERRALREEVLAQNKQENNGPAEQVDSAASANKKHAAAQFQQSSPVTVLTPPHLSVAEVGVAKATTQQTNVEESGGPSDVEDDDAAQKKKAAAQEAAHENSQQIVGSAKKATEQSSAPVEQPSLANATDVEDDHVDEEQNTREAPEHDDASRPFASEDNSSENQSLTSSERSEHDEDKKDDDEEVDNDNLDRGAYKDKTSILKKPENDQRAAEGHDQGEQQNDRRSGSPFPRRDRANNDDAESASDVEAPPKNRGGETSEDGHNSHSDRDENMNKRRHSAAHFSPFDAKKNTGEKEILATGGCEKAVADEKSPAEIEHGSSPLEKEAAPEAAADETPAEREAPAEVDLQEEPAPSGTISSQPPPASTSAAPRDAEKRSRSDSCLSSSRSSPGSARSSSRSSRSSENRHASRRSSSRVCSNKRSCTDSNSSSRNKSAAPEIQGTSSEQAPSAGPRRTSSGKSVRLHSPSCRKRSIQRPQEGKNNKQPPLFSRSSRRSSAPSKRPAPRRSIVKVSRWSCANRESKEVAAAAAAESSSRKKVFHNPEQPRKPSRKRRAVSSDRSASSSKQLKKPRLERPSPRTKTGSCYTSTGPQEHTKNVTLRREPSKARYWSDVLAERQRGSNNAAAAPAPASSSCAGLLVEEGGRYYLPPERADSSKNVAARHSEENNASRELQKVQAAPPPQQEQKGKNAPQQGQEQPDPRGPLLPVPAMRQNNLPAVRKMKISRPRTVKPSSPRQYPRRSGSGDPERKSRKGSLASSRASSSESGPGYLEGLRLAFMMKNKSAGPITKVEGDQGRGQQRGAGAANFYNSWAQRRSPARPALLRERSKVRTEQHRSADQKRPRERTAEKNRSRDKEELKRKRKREKKSWGKSRRRRGRSCSRSPLPPPRYFRGQSKTKSKSKMR